MVKPQNPFMPRIHFAIRSAALLLLVVVAPLSACGMTFSANGGVYALTNPRGHLPVGGVISGHAGVGGPLFLGADATLRATGDYVNVALGPNVSLVGDSALAPYARLGFAPISFTVRDSNFWFALNTSLDFGLRFSPAETDTDMLMVTAHDSTAWTLGLRSDLECRPAEGECDFFLSLVAGISFVESVRF